MSSGAIIMEPATPQRVLRGLVKWIAVLLLIALWSVFAVDFVVRTSHVSIDGTRYFVIFDDGMIGMRYARNLVQHHALVWNLGDRVEGFTDPLWTLFMAATIWAFGTHIAPLAMQIFGGLICLALFLFVFCLANRLKLGLVASIAGVGFLIFSYPISYWGLGGMEACALVLIYALAVGAHYRYQKGNAQNPLLLHAVLIGVAYLLRPDGWLALIPFFADAWLDAIKQKNYRNTVIAVLVPSATAVAAQFARFDYYGAWLPNTYVLKVQGYSLALRLNNGLAYLTPFFQENLAALGLIALSAITRKKIAYLNIFASVILIAYQLYVGGDPWLYWRQILPVYAATTFAILFIFDHLREVSASAADTTKFSHLTTILLICVPALPLLLFELYAYSRHQPIEATDRRPLLVLYLLAAVALVVFVTKPNHTARRRAMFLTLARVGVILVAAYSTVLCDIPFKLDFAPHKPYIFDGQAHMIDKAVLANRLFGPGKTHHLVWAGTYSYFVDGTMIDSLGKSDKAIARYPVDQSVSWDGMMGVPGHAKYDFRDSILKRKPDIVVERAAWFAQDVSPEMKDDYVLVQSQGVRLCVKKELITGSIEPLVQGSCPSMFFYTLHN
jgi:arabinofuranosyltransferase